MKPVIRHTIKHDAVARLLRGETYTSIAGSLTDKFGFPVTRSAIAGIARDVKAGTLELGAAQAVPTLRRPLTYRYGAEEPNGGLPVFDSHPEIRADRLLVIADLHAPYSNYKFIEKLPRIIKRHGIKQVLIAGDMIDGDSRHHKSRVRRANMSEQFKAARDVIGYLLGHCGVDEIFMLPGNHDEWLAYDVYGEISVDDTLRLMIPDGLQDRVTPFLYDRVTVTSGSEVWTIPHQAAASVDPLKAGRELSLKFQTNMITPHQHLSALGFDKYNRYMIISIGGLHDERMMDYVQLNTTTMYNMNVGVAVLQDGEGILITPDARQTNWRKYGGW